jgi:hypothetical protein
VISALNRPRLNRFDLASLIRFSAASTSFEKLAMTLAPSSAKRRQIALPIPFVPPVTMLPDLQQCSSSSFKNFETEFYTFLVIVTAIRYSMSMTN